MTSAKRHQRQMRLPMIGREGQRVLGELHARVGASGDEGIVAARYLAGAGVGRLTVVDAEVAASAHRLDAGVTTTIEPGIAAAPPMAELDDMDPAARSVARGARTAVRILVGALGSGRPA